MKLYNVFLIAIMLAGNPVLATRSINLTPSCELFSERFCELPLERLCELPLERLCESPLERLCEPFIPIDDVEVRIWANNELKRPSPRINSNNILPLSSPTSAFSSFNANDAFPVECSPTSVTEVVGKSPFLVDPKKINPYFPENIKISEPLARATSLESGLNSRHNMGKQEQSARSPAQKFSWSMKLKAEEKGKKSNNFDATYKNSYFETIKKTLPEVIKEKKVVVIKIAFLGGGLTSTIAALQLAQMSKFPIREDIIVKYYIVIFEMNEILQGASLTALVGHLGDEYPLDTDSRYACRNGLDCTIKTFPELYRTGSSSPIAFANNLDSLDPEIQKKTRQESKTRVHKDRSLEEGGLACSSQESMDEQTLKELGPEIESAYFSQGNFPLKPILRNIAITDEIKRIVGMREKKEGVYSQKSNLTIFGEGEGYIHLQENYTVHHVETNKDENNKISFTVVNDKNVSHSIRFDHVVNAAWSGAMDIEKNSFNFTSDANSKENFNINSNLASGGDDEACIEKNNVSTPKWVSEDRVMSLFAGNMCNKIHIHTMLGGNMWHIIDNGSLMGWDGFAAACGCDAGATYPKNGEKEIPNDNLHAHVKEIFKRLKSNFSGGERTSESSPGQRIPINMTESIRCLGGRIVQIVKKDNVDLSIRDHAPPTEKWNGVIEGISTKATNCTLMAVQIHGLIHKQMSERASTYTNFSNKPLDNEMIKALREYSIKILEMSTNTVRNKCTFSGELPEYWVLNIKPEASSSRILEEFVKFINKFNLNESGKEYVKKLDTLMHEARMKTIL